MVPIGNPLKFITRINDGCSIDFWHDWAKILLSRLVAYDLPCQIVPTFLFNLYYSSFNFILLRKIFQGDG